MPYNATVYVFGGVGAVGHTRAAQHPPRSRLFLRPRLPPDRPLAWRP